MFTILFTLKPLFLTDISNHNSVVALQFEKRPESWKKGRNLRHSVENIVAEVTFQFWIILDNFGQFWAILGNFGQFWAILGYIWTIFCIFWQILDILTLLCKFTSATIFSTLCEGEYLSPLQLHTGRSRLDYIFEFADFI